MATCRSCGQFIIGGIRDDEGRRYCQEACRQRGLFAAVSEKVPEEFVARHVAAIHQGTCPKCAGPGPVDVHTSHTVWSLLVITSWRSSPQVCCRSCGVNAKIKAALVSGVAGWWGFPFGLLITPVQIARNLGGIFFAPDESKPSAELEKVARSLLASHLIEEAAREDPA